MANEISNGPIGQEYGFSHSQARSSGILETNDTGRMDEDIDFIVGLHSESFTEAQGGLGTRF